MAHEAYTVMVVCDDGPNSVLTWQSLRTVDEDITDTVKEPEIETPCGATEPARNTVKVTLTQAGFVHLDDADGGPVNAGQEVTLTVLDGTFDLVATTNLADPAMNKTEIRRGVMITGDQTLPAIDAAMGLGQTLLAVSLDNPPSADPAKSTEIVTATVDVTTANNSGPARVSQATYNLTDKAIKLYALPSAMLMKGDTQTATFTGSDESKDHNITTVRSITKPFTTGDDTATGMDGLSLPSKIAIPGWGMDAGRLSVALPSLPSLDNLTLKTSGTAVQGGKTAKYEMHITQGYFDATSLARPVFDTNVNGFLPDWTINFQLLYSRQITTEHDAFDEGVFIDHEESQFSEQVPPPMP